jgi:NitT/TauT family transport system substrate-binding protein
MNQFDVRPVMTRGALIAGAACFAAAAGTARAADLTPVKFISTIADDLRPFLWAQNTGLFRQAGMDITFQGVGTGAIVAQEIVGGAADIGKASITSIIAAYARGIPFTIIAPGLSYRKEDPTAGILVAANSPLKTPLDLQGKVVTCSAIGDIAYLGLRALIDSRGGDSSTVKWVEMPFPAVSAAIQAGRVDAGLMGEPAMMEDVRAGKIRYFVDELTGYSRPILEVVYFTTHDYASKNREMIGRFAKVLERAAAYANTHPAETIPLLLPLTGMDLKVATDMRHGYTATKFDPSAIQPVIDLMAKYKSIPHGFEARELLV